jgi:CRISPR-associated endonuclease Cas3-HD
MQEAKVMATTTAWLSAWAKSIVDERRTVTHWLPLHQHLADAGGVAGLLVDEWVSRQVIRRIAREFPNGEADVRTAACWLAATHDIAKLTPAFCVQVPKLADLMRRNGLRASPLLQHDPARRLVPHALAGQHVVAAWLVRKLGFTRKRAEQWSVVVGGHHGVPPTAEELAAVRGHVELLGAGEWDSAGEALLDRAAEMVGGQAVLARFAQVVLSRPSQALLSAIVILADWIASNTELFPLQPIATADPPLQVPDKKATTARLARGWARQSFGQRDADRGPREGAVHSNLHRARLQSDGQVVPAQAELFRRPGCRATKSPRRPRAGGAVPDGGKERLAIYESSPRRGEFTADSNSSGPSPANPGDPNAR